jgi:hypothetical protein
MGHYACLEPAVALELDCVLRYGWGLFRRRGNSSGCTHMELNTRIERGRSVSSTPVKEFMPISFGSHWHLSNEKRGMVTLRITAIIIAPIS